MKREEAMKTVLLEEFAFESLLELFIFRRTRNAYVCKRLRNALRKKLSICLPRTCSILGRSERDTDSRWLFFNLANVNATCKFFTTEFLRRLPNIEFVLADRLCLCQVSRVELIPEQYQSRSMMTKEEEKKNQPETRQFVSIRAWISCLRVSSMQMRSCNWDDVTFFNDVTVQALEGFEAIAV